MKQALQSRVTHVVLVILAILLGLYVFFVGLEEGEAVERLSVGSMSVVLYPSPSETATEKVSLTYNGTGEINVEGWTLDNEAGFVHELGFSEIADGASLVICEDKSLDGACDSEWSGTDVWGEGGVLSLYDEQNVLVLTFAYDSNGIGYSKGSNDLVRADVRSGGDSVRVCHSDDGVAYVSRKGSIGNLTKSKQGHGSHGADIIPPFFYLEKKGTHYFGGANWPDTTGVYENNCVAQ